MPDQITSLLPQLDRLVVRQFLQLVQGIDKQDPSPADVQALREMLHGHPDLWRVYGDLAAIAARTLIQRLDARPHLVESLTCGWHAVKEDLGYSVAPPLERLLIEQVVLCSLHMYLVAGEYGLVVEPSIPQSSIDHWERRLSAVQHRYLRACESLARIRKLARTTPALQVNIATHGGQQLNLLAGEPAVDDEP
jgi:hypothetical protein